MLTVGGVLAVKVRRAKYYDESTGHKHELLSNFPLSVSEELIIMHVINRKN
jgi:hypothetical protein